MKGPPEKMKNRQQPILNIKDSRDDYVFDGPSFPRYEKSIDLQADIKLMWQVLPLRRSSGPDNRTEIHASGDLAILAASRVFNTVDLIGKTPEEVMRLLGDPRTSSASIYNFPFHQEQSQSLVYRFDNGSYGWQFNLLIGDDRRVKEIQRRWIH